MRSDISLIQYCKIVSVNPRVGILAAIRPGKRKRGGGGGGGEGKRGRRRIRRFHLRPQLNYVTCGKIMLILLTYCDLFTLTTGNSKFLIVLIFIK